MLAGPFRCSLCSLPWAVTWLRAALLFGTLAAGPSGCFPARAEPAWCLVQVVAKIKKDWQAIATLATTAALLGQSIPPRWIADASQRHPTAPRYDAGVVFRRRKHRRGWPGRRDRICPGHHLSSSPRLKQRGAPRLHLCTEGAEAGRGCDARRFACRLSDLSTLLHTMRG
jgi:hypothetical protein